MLIKAIREQLGLSKEDLSRKNRVGYATMNRWENSQTRPSRLAWAKLRAFCSKKAKQRKLKLPYGFRD